MAGIMEVDEDGFSLPESQGPFWVEMTSSKNQTIQGPLRSWTDQVMLIEVTPAVRKKAWKINASALNLNHESHLF